jgi:hypothetical protein
MEDSKIVVSDLPQSIDLGAVLEETSENLDGVNIDPFASGTRTLSWRGVLDS